MARICTFTISSRRPITAHTIVTVAMYKMGVDIDGALNWPAEYHGSLQFPAHNRLLPYSPAVDTRVNVFVERLAYRIRGTDFWSLQTLVCFGMKRAQIRNICDDVTKMKKFRRDAERSDEYDRTNSFFSTFDLEILMY